MLFCILSFGPLAGTLAVLSEVDLADPLQARGRTEPESRCAGVDREVPGQEAV